MLGRVSDHDKLIKTNYIIRFPINSMLKDKIEKKNQFKNTQKNDSINPS